MLVTIVTGHEILEVSMPFSAPNTPPDVSTVDVDASWLNANGELPVCLAQPELVGSPAIENDEQRPKSVELASMIFADEAGRPWLAKRFGDGVSGLLVFPEYAFGSDDFGELNAMISDYPQPLIALAGFGAVSGNKLRTLLGCCAATWPGGTDEIDVECSYNAGWCWIHRGPGNTVCHIFLKNYFEQQDEVALLRAPKVGKHILKVATDDVVFFPLLCADLISDLANKPLGRIAQALPRTDGGGLDANKKVLVVTLLLTNKPHHGLWSQAISAVVELHERRAGLCLVNQLAAQLAPDADADQWRCLSGGFIHRQTMPEGPRKPLRSVRYVQTEHASGLILRQPHVGVACGNFRWVHGAGVGRNVWAPDVRRIPVGGILQEMCESAEFQELRRFVQRRRGNITARYPQASSGQLIGDGLNDVLAEMNEDRISPRLWPKLLTGVEEPTPSFNADAIDDQSDTLDRALGAFVAIQQATRATSLAGPPHRGQMLWGEWEILVWNSPRHDSRKMQVMLAQCALNHSLEPQLIVVGAGASGQFPTGRIVPDRFSEITESREFGSITESRPRHIYCRPLGQIENPLLDPQMTREQRCAAILQQLAVN